MEKKSLVILTGPTAVGKTALSLVLAKQIGGEIVSADSGIWISVRQRSPPKRWRECPII